MNACFCLLRCRPRCVYKFRTLRLRNWMLGTSLISRRSKEYLGGATGDGSRYTTNKKARISPNVDSTYLSSHTQTHTHRRVEHVLSYWTLRHLPWLCRQVHATRPILIDVCQSVPVSLIFCRLRTGKFSRESCRWIYLKYGEYIDSQTVGENWLELNKLSLQHHT